LLVEAEVDGVPLTDQQVIGFCLLLLSGGHETTSKLIANGVRLFATHPESRATVRAHPEAMHGAVEELLRYTSPTQYMARTVTRDVELHDVVMPAGAKVVLLLGSGNRDPREFDRPDEFDIARTNPRILAFGHGAHVCLGAAVARLEARVALQEFLARYPDYEVDEDAVEFLHSGNVQGPTSVPVSVPVGAGAGARGA
jgi:cytochrome P450